jgi:cold shock CspA family protein
MFNSKLGFGFIKSTKTDGMIIAEFQTGEFTVKLGQKCVLFRI